MTSRIIAVGNLKGGTGKSTVAVNLACRLAEQRPSVMLIDADPQGTASAWLEDGLAAGVQPGLALAAHPLEGGAISAAPWANEIREQRRHHERIVVDLPPQMGQAFEAALAVADLLIVPVTPSAVDLYATAQALAVLHRVRRARGGRPSCLLVPSKVDRRTARGRQSRAVLARLGCEVGPALSQRAAHAEAFGAARWIGAHAPGSDAHVEVCALVEQVEDQLRCCQEAEDYRPAPVQLDAPRSAAVVLAGTQGATLRIGALCLHLLAALFARLRRAEQQASI